MPGIEPVPWTLTYINVISWHTSMVAGLLLW